MQFTPLLPFLNELGEGPVWSDSEQALYFVDIPGCRIHRVDWRTRHHESWAMPSEPGSLAPATDGTLIVAMRNGFHRFNRTTVTLTRLVGPDYDQATMRFNDGRCDPAGRFWAGTMDTTRSGARAGLWCLDRGELRQGPQGVTISNGLAFSPDGRWMYHADSTARVIYRYSFDPTSGIVGERLVWFACPPGTGDPDGASVDAEGYYWIAMYGGGCILRISPEGSVDRTISVPARCPTMVNFAGPTLDTLVITSGRRNRPAAELGLYPMSGAVFVVERCGFAGLPEPCYRD
jgi:sugar lactone lactonase YvrE